MPQTCPSTDILQKVCYDSWSRPDGTNNAYIKEGDIPAHLLEEHNKLQLKRRQQLAEQSRDIDIWGSTDIINTRTYLRAQGYLEKLSLTRDEPPPISDKLAALLWSDDNPPPLPAPHEAKSDSSEGSESDVDSDELAALLRSDDSPPPPPAPHETETDSLERSESDGESGTMPEASSSSFKGKGKGRNMEERIIRSLPRRASRPAPGSLNVTALSSSYRSPSSSVRRSAYPPPQSGSGTMLEASSSSFKGKGKGRNMEERVIRSLPRRASRPAPGSLHVAALSSSSYRSPSSSVRHSASRPKSTH